MAERGHRVNKLVTGIMKDIPFICLFRVILFKGALFCLPQANPWDLLEGVSSWKKRIVQDHLPSPGLLDDSQIDHLILCKQFLESISSQKRHIWRLGSALYLLVGKHKSCASSSEVNAIWIVLGAVARKSVQIALNISQIKVRDVCRPIGMGTDHTLFLCQLVIFLYELIHLG